MSRRGLTLQGRLALLTALAVVVAVVGVSTSAWLLARAELVRQVDTALTAQSAIADRLGGPLPPGPLPAGAPLVPEAVPVLVQLVDAGGGTSTPAGQRVLPVDDADRSLTAAPGATRLRDVELPAESAEDEPLPVRLLTRSTEGGVLLQLARPMADVQATLDRLALLLALAGTTGVLVAAFAARAVARAGLAPVGRVAAAAEEVARTTDLRAAVPVEGDDEVARVARSVNALLRALDEARQQQRQLVEDASHELRTPLTSLRSNVELLLRSEQVGTPLPVADRAALLSDVRSQLAELGHLVTELVDLAREDSAPEPEQDVELDRLVLSAVARAQRHHPAVELLSRTEPVRLNGRRGALDRAVGNLLDNAAKFGPPGGRVDVELRTQPGCAVLEVHDRGPGVAEEEREQVFERFHRSTEARSVPGSGLGLSIVRQAARHHGGEVELLPRAGGGTTARLVLPLP